MKKLFAMLLPLALLLSMAACSSENGGDPDKDSDKKDDLVTVWLLASETQYEADGSRGYSKITYTYTDDGLPLTREFDRGPYEEVWNEEDLIFESIFHPYDDILDSKLEYFYNDQGDMIYYLQENYVYDEEGNLTDTNNFGEGRDSNITYHYNDSGKIESIDWYPVKAEGGHGDEVSTVYHCEYDEMGNLIEVWYEYLKDDTTRWVCDYRYDGEGRLIASTRRNLDAAYFYWYEYNEDGQLAKMSWTTGRSQMPLDDKQVSESSEAAEGQASTDYIDYRSEVRFEYDAKGNLTARKFYDKDGELTRTDTCTYEDGELSQVIYYLGETDDDDDYNEETKYVYVDNEKDADPNAITLVRDKNGNIVKIINPDGTYVEREYKKFRLTKEEAQKCLAAQHANNRIDPAGYKNAYIHFSPGAAFELYRPILETAFYETDVWKN